MRLVKIKDVTNLGAFADMMSLQVVDGKVEAVVLRKDGEELRITVESAYSNSLKLLVEEPKEEVIKYRVVGTYMGMETIPKVFDEEYDATNYIIEMNGKIPYGEEHSLEVQPFVTLVDNTKI